MSDTYSDRGVKCGASSLTIHNYCVPGLPKIIPYTAIKSLRSTRYSLLCLSVATVWSNFRRMIGLHGRKSTDVALA